VKKRSNFRLTVKVRTKYLCGYDKAVEILQRQISQRVLHVEEGATHLTTVRNLVCNSDEEGMKETHRVAFCEGKKSACHWV
jgi:hypothetical protein